MPELNVALYFQYCMNTDSERITFVTCYEKKDHLGKMVANHDNVQLTLYKCIIVVSYEYSHRRRADYTTVHYMVHIMYNMLHTTNKIMVPFLIACHVLI